MYKDIRAVVGNDFEAVNQYIIDQLHSDVPLVENIGHYLIDAGGKRLRPVLVLLAARACNISPECQDHIPMAAVIEFIHTATLLHDDVVDMSTLRRGRPTANSQWSNPSSVLVGDFIYSRAFQILVKLQNMQIMQIMADTTNKIAEGEVLQLINKHNPDSSEANYMKVIREKTAILFQAAAECGALLAKADSSEVTALKDYGLHVGMAFQLVDDVLDYNGDSSAMGKNIGDDLAEGKPTLPLIYTMANGTAEETQLIEKCLKAETVPEDDLMRVISLVKHSGALEYTQTLAKAEVTEALDCLNHITPSKYRDALAALANFSIARQL